MDSLNIDSANPIAIEFDIASRLKSTVYTFSNTSETEFLRSCVGLEVELTLSGTPEPTTTTGILNFIGESTVTVSDTNPNTRVEISHVSILHRDNGIIKIPWSRVDRFKFTDELIQSQYYTFLEQKSYAKLPVELRNDLEEIVFLNTTRIPFRIS